MDQATVTHDNVTPVIQILTWLFLVASVLGVLTQLGTKSGILHRITSDDALITVALVFATGQSVAIHIAASHGLGQHKSALTQDQINMFLKAQWAGDLIHMPCLCFAKAALLAVLLRVTPVKNDRRAIFSLAIFITLWGFVAVFAKAFQCRLPSPWDFSSPDKCINRTAWDFFFETSNILMDLALIAIPTTIIIRTNSSTKYKIYNLAIFWARLVIIPVAVCRMIYWPIATKDPTFDTWKTTICRQILQSLEIIATNIVYLRPLLDSTGSGFSRTDDLKRRYKNKMASQGGRLASIPWRTQKKTTQALSTTGPYEGTVATAEFIPEPSVDNISENSRSQIIRQITTVEVSSSDPTTREAEMA